MPPAAWENAGMAVPFTPFAAAFRITRSSAMAR
jgi:hypothetical protein